MRNKNLSTPDLARYTEVALEQFPDSFAMDAVHAAKDIPDKFARVVTHVAKEVVALNSYLGPKTYHFKKIIKEIKTFQR